MITKKALLEAICDLDKEVTTLTIKVHEMERFMCKNPLDKEKRKPGRPRKNSK